MIGDELQTILKLCLDYDIGFKSLRFQQMTANYDPRAVRIWINMITLKFPGCRPDIDRIIKLKDKA